MADEPPVKATNQSASGDTESRRKSLPKRCEFHEAVIHVRALIRDDQQSYGEFPVQQAVLVDTETEWDGAINNIRQVIARQDPEAVLRQLQQRQGR